jgi:hypothetical protein
MFSTVEINGIRIAGSAQEVQAIPLYLTSAQVGNGIIRWYEQALGIVYIGLFLDFKKSRMSILNLSCMHVQVLS